MATINNPTDKKIENNNSGLNKNVPVEPKNLQAPGQPVFLPPENLGFRKKSVTGKVIATVFSILLLMAGVAAGVLLVQQQQEIRERAAGFDTCIKSPLCEFLDEPDQTAVHEARLDISYILISTPELRRFEKGVSEDGCFRVTISQNLVMWSRYGSGPTCPEIINIQVWLSDN